MQLLDFLRAHGVTHIAIEHCQLTESSDIAYVGTSEEEILQDIHPARKGRWNKSRYYASKDAYSYYTIEKL